MRTLLSIICISASIAASGPAIAADGPRIVASIKPVHSLVAAIMGDIGTLSLIVKGAASPHGYSLRPSQAAQINRADAVFWIGPELETFLDRPLEAVAAVNRAVRLDTGPGLTFLDLREGGAFESHEHGDQDHDEGEDGHATDGAHDEKNMHLWLNPANAHAMASHIAARLSEIDPAHAATYQANRAALDSRIDAVDRRIAADLADIRGRPFVVFHDAYRYFEARYGLAAVASFTVNPDTAPGARRLAEIRTRIAQTGAACIFAEPQFKPGVVASIVADSSIRTGVLDPLGARVEAGPDAWEAIMLGLARSLKACLGAPA